MYGGIGQINSSLLLWKCLGCLEGPYPLSVKDLSLLFFGHRLLFEGNICKFMLNMVWDTWCQLVVM